MRYIHKFCLLAFIAILLMITTVAVPSISAEQSAHLKLFDFSSERQSNRK